MDLVFDRASRMIMRQRNGAIAPTPASAPYGTQFLAVASHLIASASLPSLR